MPKPLDGIRILDLSRIWAGPYATKLLADMGADVVKIKVTGRYDNHRGALKPAPGSGNYPEGEPGSDPWNRNGWFNSLHLSKFGVTLDLASARGKEVFADLVAISDVVIENFRRGVLTRLGFDYQTLRGIRPDIVMVSMPAFGNSGPWKDFIQYGIGQEQLAGMAYMTGYLDEEGPMKSGINHGDPITGSHGAGAILASLLYRRRVGKGLFIDLSHLDSSISLIGEYMLDLQMNHRNPVKLGNRHPSMAPHGVYRCAGEDSWVAIAVATDEEWINLCQAMGMSGLASDPRFDNLLSRWNNQDELDPIISQWTCDKDSGHVTELFQAVGVPTAPVMSSEDIYDDPHFQERELLELVDHPSTGPHFMPGMGWKMSKTPGTVRWPTPRLGEHNEAIYSGLLGLEPKDLDGLEAAGIIGKIPDGVIE